MEEQAVASRQQEQVVAGQLPIGQMGPAIMVAMEEIQELILPEE